MILRLLLIAVSLLSFASADVEFTGPNGGDSISGLDITITWKDSGDSPKISQLATYQMFLCAGGNDDTQYIQLATLVQQGDFTKGNSVQPPSLSAGLGANVKNAYFIKVVSAATGGVIINFSDRFSLTSMTGVFPPVVVNGLKTVSGTKGPDTVNQISAPQVGGDAGGAAGAGGGEYATPYTLQTGSIRYAPMPPVPPTSITVKNKSRLWPKSDYTVYKTNAGPPNAITTNTLPVTFKVSSREGTAAAAAQPTDTAMAKFMNRWKD